MDSRIWDADATGENYRPKKQTTSLLREVGRTFGRKVGRERALADDYEKSGASGGVHGHEYDGATATWQRDSMRGRIGVYPGSFNPPTIAHIEIALAARDAHGLARVDLAVSVSALGKADVLRPSFEERLTVIEASVAAVDGLGLVVTEHQLIADIAAGYSVVVMGADKWHQVNDVAWYTDAAARDAAVASLPGLALAPRAGFHVPDEHRLPVSPDLLDVSSSAVRAGRLEWMTDAARAHHEATGAWA